MLIACEELFNECEQIENKIYETQLDIADLQEIRQVLRRIEEMFFHTHDFITGSSKILELKTF